VGFLALGELDLGGFRGHAQLGERVGIGAHVDAMLGLDFVREQVDHAVVEVVAAQVRVTGVARTSKTSLPISRIETSKVPPPRS